MKTNNTGPTTYRLETLTDGIFAIDMTLLVLTLTIPHITKESALTQVPILLSAQFNDLFNYALSFLLLAMFWIQHHQQFHYIKRTNNIHLWINIILLMFISLMPFTTSLISLYSELTYTNILFHANMFFVGLMFYWDWAYATNKYLLVEPAMTKEQIEKGRQRSLITPFVALAAMVLAVFSPSWSPVLYIFIPLLVRLIP